MWNLKCLGLSKCKVCWKTDGHESILHGTTARTCPSSPKAYPLGMTESWIKAIKAHAQTRPCKLSFDWSLIASIIYFHLSSNQLYDWLATLSVNRHEFSRPYWQWHRGSVVEIARDEGQTQGRKVTLKQLTNSILLKIFKNSSQLNSLSARSVAFASGTGALCCCVPCLWTGSYPSA